MRIVLIICLLSFSGFSCLNETTGNLSQVALLGIGKEEGFQILERGRCVITINDDSGSHLRRFCLATRPGDCRAEFVAPLRNSMAVEDRSEDLSFIALLYSACSAAVAETQSVYDDLDMPASVVFFRAGLNRGTVPTLNSTFTYVSRCSSVHLSDSKLMRAEDWTAVLSFDGDLGLSPAATAACLDSLGFDPGFRKLIDSIRKAEIQLYSSCTFSSGVCEQDL